jgi:predicted GNAT family N-acyltransferase
LFEEFEAAKSMVELTVGAWQNVKESVEGLRREVFVQEQGIDARLVFDDADAQALHATINNRLGQTIASGRLLLGADNHAGQVGHIGRMAVHRVLRGSNLGRDVLVALLDAARLRGNTSVVLHAQCSAQGFYERLGFAPQGERYVEAGIDHINMVMAL